MCPASNTRCRPYFSVLFAWDGDHHYLSNESYAANDHLLSGARYAHPTWTNVDVDVADEE